MSKKRLEEIIVAYIIIIAVVLLVATLAPSPSETMFPVPPMVAAGGLSHSGTEIRRQRGRCGKQRLRAVQNGRLYAEVNSPTPSLFRAKASSYCHYGNEGEDQSISEGVIAQSLIVKSGCALGRSYMLFMPLLRYDRLWSADVNRENESKMLDILPVPRTKEEAKQAYDRISRCYDYTIGACGRRYAKMALELLSIVEGEIVLEVGFGTGHCLRRIAECVGQTGKVYGIDISSGMIEITKKRLEKAGLVDRVELFRGDAAFLPFDDNTVDAVFMSFVLEVFDTPEIPRALEQVKKVLKPEGRLGVASMSKENGESIFLRLYEWIHNKWPKYVGSRPIYAEKALIDTGYHIKSREKTKLFRLPIEIIVAVKAISGNSI